MNKTVSYYYKKLTKEDAGLIMLYLFQFQPEIYEEYKKLLIGKDGYPNVVPLLKYGIRDRRYLGNIETKITLQDLKEPVDRYSMVIFKKFSGRFEYKEDEEGFAPKFIDIQGTRKMQEIWDEIEPQRIEKAWNKVSKLLLNTSGEEPILIYQDIKE